MRLLIGAAPFAERKSAQAGVAPYGLQARIHLLARSPDIQTRFQPLLTMLPP